MKCLHGDELNDYLNNLEVVELVLRKIKLMDNKIFSFSNLSATFSTIQIKSLSWLYTEKCIMNDYQDEESYIIKLTKRGQLYLFLIDNKKEIEEFIILLRDNNYNDFLIDAFLMSQDLNKSAGEILTLDNFISFYVECNKHLPVILTERNYSYRKVRIPVK